MTDPRIEEAQRGDKAALEALIREHTPLVQSVARRFFGRGTEPEDLLQLGFIGLIKAIRGFDASLGWAFSTYAVPKIAGEIRRFLRDDGPVKVSRTLRERSASVQAARERLERTLGRSPHLSELCAETGLTPEEAAEALQAPRDTQSLDALLPGQERTLGEILPAEEGEAAAESLALQEAVRALEPLQRQVILLRYARDLTQSRVGLLLGMTQVQVSRTEKRAVLALRQRLDAPE